MESEGQQMKQFLMQFMEKIPLLILERECDRGGSCFHGIVSYINKPITTHKK
jgi:hypothetical protein